MGTMVRSLALACALAAVSGAANAQTVLSGYWNPVFHEDQPERVPGPEVGDYLGMPINEAARSQADTWSASRQTMPERQCQPHPVPYEMRSVGYLVIEDRRDLATQKIDRINMTQGSWSTERTIWMDGRPHPPEWALHNWHGFSTGRWDGDVLEVHTTHLKPSFIRRNGLPMSDRAEAIERFYKHGNILHHVMIVNDPVYLTEPLVKTTIYVASERPLERTYPCRPAVEIPREKGVVPHNEFHDMAASEEVAKTHDIPLQAVRGGAETALPEFMDRFPPRPPPRGPVVRVD